MSSKTLFKEVITGCFVLNLLQSFGFYSGLIIAPSSILPLKTYGIINLHYPVIMSSRIFIEVTLNALLIFLQSDLILCLQDRIFYGILCYENWSGNAARSLCTFAFSIGSSLCRRTYLTKEMCMYINPTWTRDVTLSKMWTDSKWRNTDFRDGIFVQNFLYYDSNIHRYFYFVYALL